MKAIIVPPPSDKDEAEQAVDIDQLPETGDLITIRSSEASTNLGYDTVEVQEIRWALDKIEKTRKGGVRSWRGAERPAHELVPMIITKEV